MDGSWEECGNGAVGSQAVWQTPIGLPSPSLKFLSLWRGSKLNKYTYFYQFPLSLITIKVPLVLAAQALLFYLPSFLWKAFNFNTGINVKSVLNSAALVKKKFDKNTRNAQVHKAATHILEALEMQRELKTCERS